MAARYFKRLAAWMATPIIVYLITTAATPAAARQDEPAFNDEQRRQHLESFDYVWETVRDRYWDEALGGVDWQKVRSELRPKVESAKSIQEVRETLDDMLSRLGVSHFGIIPAEVYDELEVENRRAGTLGIEARVVDDRAIVTQVQPDSAAAKHGVKAGWEITRINEWDVSDSLKLLEERLADHAHYRTIVVGAVQGRLFGAPGDEIRVEFADHNNAPATRVMTLGPARGHAAKFGHIPEFHVWIESRKVEPNIGYIRFNAFMAPTIVMVQFNKAMNEFMECDAIIIDVRGNGGGMAEMGMGMIGWLVEDERLQVGKVILREQELDLVVRGRPTVFGGDVVVLIDEMSVSAAEFFACAIRDIDRAHLIGTRTAGAVLGSQFVKLPNGDGFQFAAANFVSIQTGESLEGIGVSPHQEVTPDRGDLLQGKDSAMEAAKEWIAERRR